MSCRCDHQDPDICLTSEDQEDESYVCDCNCHDGYWIEDVNGNLVINPVRSKHTSLIQFLCSNSLIYAPPGEVFQLASGKTSNYYLDVRKSSLSPLGHSLFGWSFLEEILEHFPNVKGVAGVALGGCPLASAVAFASWLENTNSEFWLEAIYVRKEPKSHGTKNLIEGNFKPGMKVVLLEDVTTSGNSSLQAVEKLKEAGAEVLGVITLVDREEGAVENFQNHKIPFKHLITISEVLNYDHRK